MKNNNKYQYIGASIGNCAGVLGCEFAPETIKKSLDLAQNWLGTAIFSGAERNLKAETALLEFSKKLGDLTLAAMEKNLRFITFGGDHSCAMGTWSAVAQKHSEFGLIWIDAHMDSNTPESSFSGNFHGMPIATLLGHGAKSLTSLYSAEPKIKPENIFLIGIRSFEPTEEELLKSLGANVFMMDEVKKVGFDNCFQQALKHFEANNLPYGISFDLDAIDPTEINAVGTPVADGIILNDVLNSFKNNDFANLIGMEIVEYNPELDAKNHGIEIIDKILKSLD